MDSDESDFYGDEETVGKLETRVREFDAKHWLQQQRNVSAFPFRRSRAETMEMSRLHNPYVGIHSAWQLTESIDDFLARLPPATTPQSALVPWIYICNPYLPRMSIVTSGQLGGINDDGAPEEEGTQLYEFAERSKSRLDELRELIDNLSMPGKVQTMTSRQKTLEAEKAREDILGMAQEHSVKTGKWMLFVETAEVDEVWSVVAKATANNELGIAAKVCPKVITDNIYEARKERLICVYTADFKDMADSARVLQRLRELRLVEIRGQAIYYKPDAFTILGIARGNPWGLKASLYSSKDVFGWITGRSAAVNGLS